MPKRKHLKPIPAFDSEGEERAFWEGHETTDYVDWTCAKLGIFPNLRPSTETISLRLPAGLLAGLRILANKRDVPYQSLLKVFLAERVTEELTRESGASTRKPMQRSARSAGRR